MYTYSFVAIEQKNMRRLFIPIPTKTVIHSDFLTFEQTTNFILIHGMKKKVGPLIATQSKWFEMFVLFFFELGAIIDLKVGIFHKVK